MRTETRTRRGGPGLTTGRPGQLAMLLTVLLAWLMPQQAAATYVDDTYRYSVMLSGANTFTIKAPIYDEKADDHWVDNGYLKATWTKDGTTYTETVLWWSKDEDSHNNDDKDLWTKFYTNVGGSFDITQGNSGSHFTLTKGDGTQRRLIYKNNDGNTFDFTAVWRVPYDMLGCTVKFSWDIRCDYTNGLAWDTHYSVSPSGTELTLPKAQSTVAPQITMATMSYSEVGKLEMPWFMSATTLNSVRYQYHDANGIQVRQDLPTNESSGTIYLDATVPHDNFGLVVSYKDNSGYLIENISSETQNLQMIHAPVGFHATQLGNRKAAVKLDWHIRYTGTNDITSSDFFEVQRSLTGREEDFTTIGSVPFVLDGKNPNFTYIDSTLIDAITAAQLTAGSSLPGLTYRVRRMLTQNWGWDGNPCAQSVAVPISGLHLQRLKSYEAKLADERSYSVRVTWDYVDEPNAVWDNRATLRMVITMRNNDGDVVDTKTFDLTDDERTARAKVIDLSKPCVKYDIRMFVDPGTSPLRSWDMPDAMRITSAADWKAFCEKVKAAKGEYDVNAVLCTDITTNEYCGEDGALYRGTFDGNGHTLTINMTGNAAYTGIFCNVKNATIRNLHVTGNITSGMKFIGGIVAYAGGNTIIENCRSSVTINSTINGDATNGGLVALTGYDSDVTIHDCLFDGSFTGANCDSNGGLVGWGYGKVTILNSHFNPAKIETKFSRCQTFARMNNYAYLTVTNSYFTTPYLESTSDLYVIRSKADWKTFQKAVADANESKDVNALLAADLVLTIDDMIGYENFYKPRYRGTFDGNGHLLHLDFTKNDEQHIALFSGVTGSTTIKNLWVTGEVNTNFGYIAALVGQAYYSCTDLTFDHVQVSTSVKAGTLFGGFVSKVREGCQVTFTDCLFDGKLISIEDAGYASCFIASGAYPGNYHQTRVYERSTYESKGFSSGNSQNAPYAMNMWDGRNGDSRSYAWRWSDTEACLSSHAFREVVENCRNITNQDTVVARMNANMPGQWEIARGGHAEPVIGMTSVRLLTALGPCWQKVGYTVVPKTATTDVNPSALDDFYHEGTGRIGTTLHTETRQSSVVLTWDVEDGPVDYFSVYRREAGTTNFGNALATNIDKNGYEDTSVSPLKDYEYRVFAISDCEGQHSSYTAVAKGACKHTGRVSGYVRMNDGTAVAGMQIEIAPTGGVEGTPTTAYTDDAGYFEADELSYYGRQSITYNVTPVSSSGIQLERGSYPVTFNDRSNDEQVHEFIVTSGHRFSGYVMYDGTSIPVKGAHFRVDGRDVHNAAGDLVVTDFDGSFSFRVLDGTHRIQAVMDGHTFTNDGYYKGATGHNFTDDVVQIYFYDATKVRLAGRVVGGDAQGCLPLEHNLSKNNLGSDLTMVFTLEGDNTSWLVYDNQNPTLSERNDTIRHSGGLHETTITTQRKRMSVKPDSITGEYELLLPPVRWKVQQVYCKGYATLFQDGQVSEVVDLTDCLAARDTVYKESYTDVDGQTIYQPHETANATYSRIYHAPVEITYRQMGYDSFDYFGDRTYTATNLGSDRAEVPLAYQDQDKVLHYTFGHPVFNVGRSYPIEISVGERYLYNNDTRSGREDRVSVGGGTVTVHNGMKNGTQQETVTLNADGQGLYQLFVEATTRLLTGEDALHTVTMTLTQDGTTYEAEPLRGYTLNMFSLGGAKDVLVNDQPLLIDILRDPPGGGSSATLSKGSTLKYSYKMDMSLSAGISLKISTGKQVDNYTGSVAAPNGAGTTAGILNSASSTEWINMDYAYDMEGHKAYTYTMNVGEDISTSSEMGMVGSPADLFIGMTQNIVVTSYSTIRAIPDAMYQQMLGRLGGSTTAGVSSPFGSLVHIAEGTGGDGKTYHLVRDESLGYGPELRSQFIHSQKHILTELIPQKVQEVRSLMFIGTAAEAQARANATKKPVYRSLRSEDDSRFALMNTKDGKPYYYTSTMKEEQDMNYVIHLPAKSEETFSDEVADGSQIIYAWAEMIGQNEHEKLVASDLVANYDVDGGSKLAYSESFTSDYDHSNYYHLPGIVGADYFAGAGSDAGTSFASTLGIQGANFVMNLVNSKVFSSKATGRANEAQEGSRQTSVAFAGSTFAFSLLPILDYTVKDVSGETHTFNRKESFSISMDKLSHLNFDVYRVLTDTTAIAHNGLFDVFTNRNFADLTHTVDSNLRRGIDILPTNIRYARSFVYRTRGGATCNPWENQRTTSFWQPGAVLDERTKKIENPKITAEQQSLSGVPYGEPARFTIHLTNDSEDPDAARKTISTFDLYVSDTSNPYGAKITCDGKALDGSGRSIILTPGQVVTKVIEVTGGNSFDLEGLTLGIASSSDWKQVYDELKLDVHYLHTAGPVNLSLPGDKWVMNTYSEYDKERGWFLPVVIDGFDKHQHNFDHIELQYKESLRGDDAWTNLCSYYADATLMAAASGEREMIPENGNIRAHFYGEGTVMEKAYDLRAVLYCRNGNDFLTTASPIVSGVKDTRRPQLFGTPEPANGILNLGDNIIFNFSEDIEHNYLSAITNFEVKGEVNNDNVSEAVSLQFDGQGSVESEAQRNFSGKDVTIDLMIRPDNTGRDMPLFSHGTNGKKLQLWLTGDSKLKAIVDGQAYTSTEAIAKGGFTQVALSIDQQNKTLTFYNGGLTIGSAKLAEAYNGSGPLIFGRTNETDRKQSQYYSGRMMEARVWYRAMTGGEVGTTYGSKRLTGYEMGLVDYYPMNEGSGDYALDKTQGANATLMGASWARPRGYSLALSGDGVALTQTALSRTAEQDYTMMFWFKTADGGTLLSNGSGQKSDAGAGSQFRIGIDDGRLSFRSNGVSATVADGCNDDQWHHYAMTVNRARGVANIYLDQTLRATLSPDSLGGISGGDPRIGGSGATGHVDELCMFQQALPLSLVKAYSTKSPNGDEAGLMTYLSFDRQERQKSNDIETVAYAWSKKVYLDDMGEVRYELDPTTKQATSTPVRDYVFVAGEAEVLKHITNETAAPVVPYEELTNLKFSFVGKDNQVLVGLDELASRLNRRNVYVTVRDIEDKNGNAMASPATATYYVRNSSLQWVSDHLTWETHYGWGEYVYLDVYNTSATPHTFTIENCPKWLTLSTYSDVVGPMGSTTISGRVNTSLNVGSYDEIIYLTDEDGVSEPFYLNLTVVTAEPEWSWQVGSDLLENSMNIVGQVYLNGEIDIDTKDIVGVFDRQNVCHGFANVSYSALTGESGLYMTVYDSQASGRELYFKLWQHSTGKELVLTADGGETLTFQKSAILGTDTPVRFEGGGQYVQTFELKEGWNWISFNVASEKLADLNNLLAGLPWQDGDVLTDMNSNTTLAYQSGQWLATGDVNSTLLSPKKAYAIRVQQDIQFPIGGRIIKSADDRTITVHEGWNGIGYTPMMNLSVETALSDYYDKAEPGDVIKSHDEFAYFTMVGGTGRWRGNLEYMKPGEGYMLLRKAADQASFTYPFYEPGSTFLDEWAISGATRGAARTRAEGSDESGDNDATASSRATLHARSRSTMSLSAVVEGFEMQAGDRLVAYSGGAVVGYCDYNSYRNYSDCSQDGAPRALSDDGEAREPLYLSIAGEKPQGIWFAIERPRVGDGTSGMRDGEIVAATGELMTFKANAVVGSPDAPATISFTRLGREDGQWYSVSGIRLPKRPTKAGVYIFNGKKVVIK